MMAKMLNILYQIKPIYRFTKYYQLEQKHMCNGVLKIADEICEEKHQQFLNQKLAFLDEDDNSKKPINFISALLKKDNKFSDQEIKDEINTLIGAVNNYF